MSEEKQVPAVVTEKEQLPFLNLGSGKHSLNKATEKVEMQRATAQVYGAIQYAMMNPRNEEECGEKILKLCSNPYFAARALYRVPRGGDVAEGINVHAAHEMARIWGNLQDGFTDHGRYGNEYQFQAYCWDIETNVTYTAPFTVEAIRQYSDGSEKEITKKQEIEEMCKARASKETRNAILKMFPFYLKEQVIKECKATLRKQFTDYRATWEGFKKAFAKNGINPKMLLDWLNCKSDKDIDVAHVVDLKILWDTALKDPTIIDEEFPKRDKSKNSTEEESSGNVVTEKPPVKKSATTAAKTSETASAGATATASPGTTSKEASKTKQSASAVTAKNPASQSAPAETTAESTQETKKPENETENTGIEKSESESASVATETEDAETSTATVQSDAESTTEDSEDDSDDMDSTEDMF